MIKKLYTNPKKLFLYDGLGAIISAFLLGLVFPKFESFLGIPLQALYLLAAIPVFITFYDFFCYQKTNINTGYFLKILVYINLSYCILSISLALFHIKNITIYGWIYLFLEIAIIIYLTVIEYRTSSYLSSKNRKNDKK